MATTKAGITRGEGATDTRNSNPLADQTGDISDTVTGENLQQTGVVGPAPALPKEYPIVPGPPVPYELGADLTQEYTAAYPRATLAYAETLPPFIDELTETIGSDLYAKMLRDSQVFGDLQYLKLAALANGITLTPAKVYARKSPTKPGEEPADPKKKAEPDLHPEAMAARDFCQAALDGMSIPLYDVLFSMLDAVALGHSVAEIVFRRDGNSLTLDKIKHKQPGVFAFVTDNRRNTIGLMVIVAGQGLYSLSQRTIYDPNQLPNLLPRKKFAILTNQPKGSDPRGRSLLYAAYDPWFQKQQHKLELLKYLVQFGSPSLVGVTAEKAVATASLNADGTVALGANGQPITLPPTARLLNVLQQFRSGSALAVPFGTEVIPIFPQGNGEAFRAAIALDNVEISKAILSQTLTTNEGEHDSRAASTNAKDVSDLLVDYVERILASMVKNDILKLLLEVNKDRAYADRFCPEVTFSKVEEADYSPFVTAAAAAGYEIDPEQFPEVDAKIGLTPRSDEAVQRTIDQKAAAAMPPPMPGGAKPPAGGKTPPTAKKNFADAEFGWVTIDGHHLLLGSGGGGEGGGGGGGGGAGEATPGGGGAPVQPEQGQQQPEASTLSEKAQLAKQTSRYVGADVQRYSEEHNEPILAKQLGGQAMKDNEPIDVEIRDADGKVLHGVEMKTMTDNKNGQIFMKPSAVARKQDWVKENKAPLHTVVFDDQKVFNAEGPGKHGPESARQMYYRRGFGSYRVSAMHPVKDTAELKSLMEMKDSELPAKARPMANYTPP